jgi:hypothetical protein
MAAVVVLAVAVVAASVAVAVLVGRLVAVSNQFMNNSEIKSPEEIAPEVLALASRYDCLLNSKLLSIQTSAGSLRIPDSR